MATTFSADVPQIYVDVDRTRAEALGVSVADIYSTIGASFGSRYVNDFTLQGRVFQVNLQADAEHRAVREDILNLHVRNRTGAMVPLRTVVSTTTVLAPFVISRYNLSVAARSTGRPRPAAAPARPWTRSNEWPQQELPAGYGFEWSGLSVPGTAQRRAGAH